VIYRFNKDRPIYTDIRTEYDFRTRIATVYPIKKCTQGYYHYVCPVCSQIHIRHSQNKMKDIQTGCGDKRPYEHVINPVHGLVKHYPDWRMTLVTKG